MLWEELCKFDLREVPVYGLKHVDWIALPLEKIFRHPHSLFLPSTDLPSIIHSFAKQKKPSMVLVNSLIESSMNDSNELFMVSSSIQTTQPHRMLQLAGRAYVINAKVDIDEVRDLFSNFLPHIVISYYSVDPQFLLERQRLYDWILDTRRKRIEIRKSYFLCCGHSSSRIQSFQRNDFWSELVNLLYAQKN